MTSRDNYKDVFPPARKRAGHLGRLWLVRLYGRRSVWFVLGRRPDPWTDPHRLSRNQDLELDAPTDEAPAPVSQEEPAILSLLQDCGAHRVPHRGATLLDHLIGVWRVARAWRQPRTICRFALGHSTYSTASFPRGLVPWSQRERVAAVFGQTTERLIFLECTSKQLGRRFDPDGALRLRLTHRASRQRLLLDTPGSIAMSVMRAAHIAELSCDMVTGGPSLWMFKVSRLLHRLGPDLPVKPSLFERCSRVISRADERAALRLYERAVANPHDPALGRTLREARRRNPWAAEPALLLGAFEGHRGNWTEAAAHAREGLDLLNAWGCAWDKRQDFSTWLQIGRSLADGRFSGRE